MNTEFSIGKLSKLTDCKVPTIRYYEDIGLLPPASRTEGNQRRYGERHLSRLRFILHGRELGFSLDEVRELISLSHDEVHNHQADVIAEKHLKDVELKIRRLQALKDELQHMVAACKAGQGQSCHVIEVLSDHSLCRHEH